jgi:hypothetical protein
MRRIKNQKIICKTDETSWKMYAKNNTPVTFSLLSPLDIQFTNANKKPEKTTYFKFFLEPLILT